MSKRKATDDDWRERVKLRASIQEQYQYLLEHDILTDCTFVVGPEDGETREFKAHRVHIARVNPVFEAMLVRCAMVEAKTGHVRVTDVSPNIFQLLLGAIYGKNPETTTFLEAQDLAFAADKYQMKTLLEICVTRMSKLITPENIWAAFETADLLRNDCLKKSCIQLLRLDTLRFITDPGFMQATEENVALLLEQDVLNVDDEPSLVNIIVHWARHAARQRGLSDDDSGVRAVLKPRLLSLFRFLAMSPQQFLLGPGLAGWLTSDEISDISERLQFKIVRKLPQHLSSVAKKRKNVTFASVIAVEIGAKNSAELFVCKREIASRRPDVLQEYDCECDCQNLLDTDVHRYCKCLHAMLIFRAKASCQWLGFQCATRCRHDPVTDLAALSYTGSMYRENIQVILYTYEDTLSEGTAGKCVGKMTFERYVDCDSTTSVMFKEPIPLIPDHWFSLQVVYRSYKSVQQVKQYPNPSRARSARTAAGVEFEFHTEDREDCYNSMNDGLFESLIFSL